MVRIKNRYITVQIVPQKHKNTTAALHMNDYKIAKCILQNVQKYYGICGLASIETGFRVKYCNERTKIAIIRCLHRSYKHVTSILPLITMIGTVNAKFRTLYVGATIMQCNKFILKHQRRFLDRYVGQIASAKEKRDLIKSVLEFEL